MRYEIMNQTDEQLADKPITASVATLYCYKKKNKKITKIILFVFVFLRSNRYNYLYIENYY